MRIKICFYPKSCLVPGQGIHITADTRWYYRALCGREHVANTTMTYRGSLRGTNHEDIWVTGTMRARDEGLTDRKIVERVWLPSMLFALSRRRWPHSKTRLWQDNRTSSRPSLSYNHQLPTPSHICLGFWSVRTWGSISLKPYNTKFSIIKQFYPDATVIFVSITLRGRQVIDTITYSHIYRIYRE